MCMACEMEAMWFAAMEARARAVTAHADEADAPVETGAPATRPPPPEEGERVLPSAITRADHLAEPTSRFSCEEPQAE
jgi:hypothetical protein